MLLLMTRAKSFMHEAYFIWNSPILNFLLCPSICMCDLGNSSPHSFAVVQSVNYICY